MTAPLPTAPPQVLLAHHLKALKLPTILREYDKQAKLCAAEGVDHTRFLLRLVELELIERDPFAGRPPRYVRAMEYDYQFTNFTERRQTGNWWKRELKGAYFPPISLRPQAAPEKP